VFFAVIDIHTAWQNVMQQGVPWDLFGKLEFDKFP